MTHQQTLTAGEVVRLVTEAVMAGGGDLGRAFYIAPDAADYSVVDETVPGSEEHAEAWQRRRLAARAAVSDLSLTTERVIENGDTVGRVFTIRGTLNGRPFEQVGMDMVRVRDGRVVQHWAVREPRD